MRKNGLAEGSTSYMLTRMNFLFRRLQIGIRKIFTNEADFHGLSQDTGLFVDDVVQLVTIKVDGEMAAPNFLTGKPLACISRFRIILKSCSYLLCYGKMEDLKKIFWGKCV